MFQKNSYSSIFGSCYQPTPTPSSPIQRVKLNPNGDCNSKESKISLKKVGAHSARSNASCRLMKDITLEVAQHRNKDNGKMRWMPFQSTNLLLNPPSYQKTQVRSQHQTTPLTSQHPSAAKLIHFQYSTQTKQDLQKTVKATHCRGQRIKSHNIQNIVVHQQKVLDKKAFISRLISYRESLVSINVQNQNSCPKLEESSIMVDYFNPTQSKVSQIHNYLSLQR